LYDADKNVDRIIKSYLLTFFGVIGIGFLTLWFIGWHEIFNQLVIPGLLLVAFVLAFIISSFYNLIFRN
jgi:hypothetical protein